jgi:hypothetical protein
MIPIVVRHTGGVKVTGGGRGISPLPHRDYPYKTNGGGSRGTWARVAIGRFRRLVLQNFCGHRASLVGY